MSQPPVASLKVIAVTVALAAAFCAETYVASGWQHFEWKTQLKQLVSTKVGEEESGENLRALIQRTLHCDADTDQQASNRGTKHSLSTWLSPYRQFPEVPPEGDNRGKGDYEYFAYIADSKCGRVSSNYGAFKGSPADQVFAEASKQGLQAELVLAKKLGYDMFTLDTRKIWLAAHDRDLCRQNARDCKETNDGFMIVNLKARSGLTDRRDFLLHSVRMGLGMTMFQSIEAHSITAARGVQWYAWETPKPGTAFHWSNSMAIPKDRIDLLTPAIGDETPANLRTTIVANPSVKSLLVELRCTKGNQSRIRLTVRSSRNISSIASKCLPDWVKSIQALGDKGEIPLNEAPQLTQQDSRKTFFGIMYSMN
jgi:hypothetical protein